MSDRRLRFSKRYEAFGAFVPKYEFDAAQALEKGEASYIAQTRMISQYFRKAIKRHRGRQVMHMVDADIPCRPTQQDGKIVVRAAVQRGVLEIPAAILGPVRFRELMLNVEQPHAYRGCHQGDWRLHHEKGADPHQPQQARDDVTR